MNPENDDATTLYSMADTELEAEASQPPPNEPPEATEPDEVFPPKELEVAMLNCETDAETAASEAGVAEEPALPETATPRPFIIEIEKQEEEGGHFIPSARLLVTVALRTSGL